MSIMVFLKVAHWSLRHELSHHEGLLFNQDRVIIPSSLGTSLLDKLHAAHRGPEFTPRHHAIVCLSHPPPRAATTFPATPS